MSQSLTLQINDRSFDAMQTVAASSGISIAQVAAKALERQFRNETPQSEIDKQIARERFERHFGELNLGSIDGSDNDSIDADLAREYASDHEAN